MIAEIYTCRAALHYNRNVEIERNNSDKLGLRRVDYRVKVGIKAELFEQLFVKAVDNQTALRYPEGVELVPNLDRTPYACGLGVGDNQRSVRRSGGGYKARADSGGRIYYYLIKIILYGVDKLGKYRRAQLVFSVERRRHKIQIFVVFAFIYSLAKGAVTADRVGSVKQNFLLDIEHNVKSAHSAVAVDKQNLFALFYQSDG